MPFKKQFNGSDVIAAIKYQSDSPTTALIAEHVGCSMQTAHNLLTTLLESGCVQSVNRGTENRPAILWSRTAKAIQNPVTGDVE